MLRYYPALIHKDRDSDYGVSFPDFPGCVSAGVTHSEALVMAKEALALHIECMLEDGESLPDPTPWERLPTSEITRDGGALVTLIETAVPGPSQRVNITVEQSLLARIDVAAAAIGTNRSAFLCEAARAKVDETFFERRLAAYMDGGMRPIEAVRRIIKEDEKATLPESHPPDIHDLGKTRDRRDREKTRE